MTPTIHMSRSWRSSLTSVSAICACLASPSHAQSASAPQTAARETATPNDPVPEDAIPDIVVTARKTRESLQSVPLSVTALTANQLAARDVRDVYSLQNSVPNFSFDKAFGRRNDRPSIRGQSNIQGEANAAFFVDGAYVSGSITGTSTENLERIEILRGPQAALFGRATFAGAINYVTRQPTDEWTGSLAARAGMNQDYRLSAWVAGPIVPGSVQVYLGASAQNYAGAYRNNNPGTPGSQGTILFAPTRADNSRVGSERQFSLTGRVRMVASSALEFNLKGEVAKTDDAHLAAVFIGGGELNCFLPIAATSTARSRGYYCGETKVAGRTPMLNLPDFVDGLTSTAGVSPPEKPGNRRDTTRLLADARLALGGWSVLLQGSYNTDDAIYATDADYTIQRPLSASSEAIEDLRFRNRSVEFRITSPRGTRLSGQAGVYWFDERSRSRARTLGASPIVFKPDETDFTISTTENFAVFGQVQLQLVDGLTLSGETRWAREKKAVSTTRPATATFESFTPRVTLDYKITDRAMIYALVAKGNKPGGFNTALYSATGVSQPSFDSLKAQGFDRFSEETSTTYEVGTKLGFDGGRGTFNLAGFYIDWRKQQLTRVVDIVNAGNLASTAAILVNAGKSRIVGMEAELAWRATPQLTLGASYGLAASRILAYNDGEIAILTGVDDPKLLQGGNAAGRMLPNTPKHTISLNANFLAPIAAGLSGFADSNLRYETKRFGQVDNYYWTGDVTLLNARLGVRSANWEVAVYGDNLLNDLTPTGIGRTVDRTQPSFVGGTRRGFSLGLRRGREVGVTTRLNF